VEQTAKGASEKLGVLVLDALKGHLTPKVKVTINS
jgi:hypothetical protein